MVPVKPICPKLSGEQFFATGLSFLVSVSGLSKHKPRRFLGQYKHFWVNSLTVFESNHCLPIYLPLSKYICIKTAKSVALANKPACPPTPPNKAAPGSCT